MGRALGALPVSEATIDELDQLLRDAEASPPPWQVPWRRQAIDIITARRAEIAASLNRQEAGTFAGRIYEGQGLRSEFLDARRAAVSRFGAASLGQV
jgi:hypothetical protein